jgi:hypothetical protein
VLRAEQPLAVAPRTTSAPTCIARSFPCPVATRAGALSRLQVHRNLRRPNWLRRLRRRCEAHHRQSGHASAARMRASVHRNRHDSIPGAVLHRRNCDRREAAEEWRRDSAVRFIKSPEEPGSNCCASMAVACEHPTSRSTASSTPSATPSSNTSTPKHRTASSARGIGDFYRYVLLARVFTVSYERSGRPRQLRRRSRPKELRELKSERVAFPRTRTAPSGCDRRHHADRRAPGSRALSAGSMAVGIVHGALQRAGAFSCRPAAVGAAIGECAHFAA